jgi:hypothetical protein
MSTTTMSVSQFTTPGSAPVQRSNRPDVRNPMLRMPEIAEGWAALPPDSRAALVGFLQVISKAARAHGAHHMEKRKFQSGAYWMAKAVDSRHLALAARHCETARLETDSQAGQGAPAQICGKVSDGHPCRMPFGSGCPDCTVSLHDVPEGS